MSFATLIEMIVKLPQERVFHCQKCGESGSASILSIYAECSRCSTRQKLRGHGGIGVEVEDVIDAVLKWMSSGATLDAAMKRKQELDRHGESE